MSLLSWLKNFQLDWIKTSPERREFVVRDVSAGSEPGIRFYLLLTTSALIAAFGLIANSAAVIIGAMLVSPLMTPIIGSALGLVIGDGRLFANSLRSVVVGTVLAIFFSALLGILPLALEATPEMLARTSPTLLDLCVAILAGFAGSYAMIDEKVSPALPGVAIAVAIVPPLSNTGICLALGYYNGAFGSFMLFFANFLSILLVSAATFMAAGMTPDSQLRKDVHFVRSLIIAIVGFIVVAGFLTYSLIAIVKDRHLKETIQTVLSEQFDKLHSTSVDDYLYDVEDGKVYILASVRSPIIMSPQEIKRIEGRFNEKINMPVELIVRSIISKDVSAYGTANEVKRQNLDGFFITKQLSPDQKTVRLAEQVILEKLDTWPRMRLLNVELVDLPRGPTILATLTGFRYLKGFEVDNLEKTLRDSLEVENMNLIIRTLKTDLTDRHGDMIYGWQYSVDPSREDHKVIRDAANLKVLEIFERYDSRFPTNVHERFRGEELVILAEVVGDKPMTPEEVAAIEGELRDEFGIPVSFDVWYRTDAIITSEGYQSFDQYNEVNVHEVEQKIKQRNMQQN